MNKRLIIIFGSIGVLLLVLIILMAVSFTNQRTDFSDTTGDTADGDTVVEENPRDSDTVTDQDFQGSTAAIPEEDTRYVNDPSVESRIIFGSSLSYYTHKELADQTKITLKPEIRDGRRYIIMTGKGCKTLSFYFYDNSDRFYNIAEKRTAQNVEYVYVEGPVLSDPKTCKDELRALDPRIKEESLFIFRSLR